MRHLRHILHLPPGLVGMMVSYGAHTPHCSPLEDHTSYLNPIGPSTNDFRRPPICKIKASNPKISFLPIDCCIVPNIVDYTHSSDSGELPVHDSSLVDVYNRFVMIFCSLFILSLLLSHLSMLIFEFVSLVWLCFSPMSVRRINGSRGVSRHNPFYGYGYVQLVIRCTTVNGYRNRHGHAPEIYLRHGPSIVFTSKWRL